MDRVLCIAVIAAFAFKPVADERKDGLEPSIIDQVLVDLSV